MTQLSSPSTLYRSRRLLSHWFLFNHRWINLVWLAALGAAVYYQTELAYYYNSNDTTNTYLRIARVGAYNLLILLAVLWLPVMRHGTTWLRQSGLGKLLPLQHTKALHQWLGHTLLALACMHGAFYLLYFDTLDGDFTPVLLGEEADLVRAMRTTMYEFVTFDEDIEEIKRWVELGWPREMYDEVVEPVMKDDCAKCHSTSSTQTYAIPALPLTDYESVKSLAHPGVQSRQFRVNVSGISMLALFACIWVSSLAVIRKRRYPWFQKIHRLGYAIAVLALLHIPRIEFVLAPGLLLLLELVRNRLTHCWRGREARLTRIGDSHVELTIPLPRPIRIPPGYFVQVRIPSLNRKEWHAFSLTNSADECRELTLIIKDLGDWTGQLVRHAERSRLIDVDVRGPYASPMQAFKWRKPSLFVAGGVGITPILGIVDACDSRARPRPIHLVWTFQDWHLFAHLAPRLARWMREHPQVGLSCHATRERPGDVPLPDDLPFTIHRGRPDLDARMRELDVREPDPHAVFVCGPKGLTRSVSNSLKPLPSWRLHVEHF